MLEDNTAEHDIALFGLEDPRQGIVHVVGPELGLALPGLLIVCGDSQCAAIWARPRTLHRVVQRGRATQASL